MIDEVRHFTEGVLKLCEGKKNLGVFWKGPLPGWRRPWHSDSISRDLSMHAVQLSIGNAYWIHRVACWRAGSLTTMPRTWIRTASATETRLDDIVFLRWHGSGVTSFNLAVRRRLVRSAHRTIAANFPLDGNLQAPVGVARALPRNPFRTDAHRSGQRGKCRERVHI